MKLCNFEVGSDQPFFLLSGPCVVESEKLTLEIAASLKEMTDELGIPYIFKASFDKANRSSINGYRGPGMEEGLRILEKVKTDLGLPIITDVHEDTPLDEVASVVDDITNTGIVMSANEFYSKRSKAGFTCEYQKRPIHRTLGYEKCG